MFLQVAMVLALMTVADPSARWVDVLVGATVTLTLVSGADAIRTFWRARPVPAPAV
jgi:hypothetical protein